MTLLLIVLIVVAFVCMKDSSKRAEAKKKEANEEKQRNYVNVPLQDKLEKKYFIVMMNALRKADREKRIYRKEIINIIEKMYDKYGLVYENEDWLTGKTREQYRAQNYETYKRELHFAAADFEEDEDFFDKISLEQIIFCEDNPLIKKFAYSDYLFGKPDSTSFFDKNGELIKSCDLSSCEHYDDYYKKTCYRTCLTNVGIALHYDATGRCDELRNRVAYRTAVRLIDEFIVRATKKALMAIGGYSYSYSRKQPSVPPEPPVNKEDEEDFENGLELLGGG